jgi:hypothetical protein
MMASHLPVAHREKAIELLELSCGNLGIKRKYKALHKNAEAEPEHAMEG